MLTVKEAAKLLRVSDSKVYEMIRLFNGKLFPNVRLGKAVRIPRGEFIEWINAGGLKKFNDDLYKAEEEYYAKNPHGHGAGYFYSHKYKGRNSQK